MIDKLNLPKAGHIQHNMRELEVMMNGMVLLGMRIDVLQRAQFLISKLGCRVDELQGADLYIAGQKDGHDAAFASGLITDD